MKKLLLYLMALFAFGIIPVDSFADTWLKVPKTTDNFKNDAEASSAKFPGADNKPGNVTMSGVNIGTGEFTITTYSTVNGGTHSWYTITKKTKSVTPSTIYGIKKLDYSGGTAPDRTTYTGSNNPYMTVDGAENGDKFDVFVDLDNESLQLIPDYSSVQITFRYDGHWGDAAVNLPKNGRTSYNFNTGNNEGFNLWFTKNGTDYVFPMENYKIPSAEWDNGEWIGEYEDEDLIIKNDGNNYISGLDKNTNYSVTIDYPNKMITINKIPTELYLIGDVSGSWEATSKDWKFNYDTDSKTFKFLGEIDKDKWFSINEGNTVNNSRYRTSAQTLTVPTSSKANLYYWNNQYESSMKVSKTGTYLITVEWGDGNDNKYISFEEVNLEQNDFTDFQLVVHYGNGSTHVTRVNPATDNIDGNWVTVDKGYEDRGMAEVGEAYDGLGLGLQNFYIETISKKGAHRYWALAAEDGVYEIPTSTSLVMTQFSTADEAANAMRMSSSGNANSRYDISWDWKNHAMTVELNSVWASYPNQMYLYCLNNDVEGNLTDMEDYPNVTIQKILDILNDNRTNNKVFVLERSRDGLYEYVFDSTNDKDLVKGTKFCIVGRTGQIYNIKTDDKSSYIINDDWEDFRLELTTDAAQQPALIDTDEISVADCFARVRVPNTLEGSEQNESYLLTFVTRTFPPKYFKLYSSELNSNTKTFVADFTTDAAYFSIDDINLSKNLVYYLEAEYSDGTKAWFGPQNERNVGVDNFESDITKGSANGFVMSLKNYESAYANMSIMWNNGSPVFAIQPDGVDKTIKVFFVDRRKWNNVKCYAYSDLGLKTNSNNTWDNVEASKYNKAWPGADMTPTTSSMLYDKVQMEDGTQVFEITLNVTEYSNGSFDLPKVIFNNGNSGTANQTKNLFLVDGGIYSNASPLKELKDKDGNNVLDSNGNKIYFSEYEATEYLPRMQYNYMDSPLDQDVLEYPNDFHSTDYNTIYVDVPEFLQWIEDGNQEHDIAISISYDRDGDKENGKEYVALGIPGTHRVYPVTIGTKTLLKVDLAGVIIPDNTKVDLKIWPTHCVKYNNEYKNWYSDFNDAHHNGSNANCTTCTDSKGVTYTGDHFTCYATKDANGTYNNHCPLIFTNVIYKNGNVYRRYMVDENTTQDPVVKILDITKPEKLYIRPNNATYYFSQAVANGYLSATDETVGTIEGCRQLLITDPYQTAKLVYLLPKINKDAQFYLVADYGNGTVIPFSASSDVKILPGNPYKYQQKQTSWMGISTKGYEQVNLFDGTISWTDSEVTFTANKKDAEFEFVDSDNNLATGKVLQLPAHSDDCPNVAEHLTKITFNYASGYDNYADDYSRLDKLKVELRRDPDFEKYFNNDFNKEAEIIPNPDNQNRLITIMENGHSTTDTKGQAYVYVRGYTAGMTTLHIEQSQSDNNYKRSGIDIPIRIIPTVESVGLYINNVPVTSVGGQYKVSIACGDHYDGNVNFRNKLQLQATTAADYITEDGDKIKALAILWGDYEESEEQPTPPAERPSSIVRRAGAFSNISTVIGDVNEDKYADVAEKEGLTEFHIMNAPVLEDDKTANKNIKLQFQQNGINSPMYSVFVSRDNDQLTEIEEILGAENDSEAVYYNLNGVKVNAERLEPGIYIKVQGDKSEKVYIR